MEQVRGVMSHLQLPYRCCHRNVTGEPGDESLEASRLAQFPIGSALQASLARGEQKTGRIVEPFLHKSLTQQLIALLIRRIHKLREDRKMWSGLRDRGMYWNVLLDDPPPGSDTLRTDGENPEMLPRERQSTGP